MIHAIILGGGAGTRFWPLSRQDEPKQFLNLCSDRPMLEQTIIRLKKHIKPDNIYIATNKIYQGKIHDCLKGLGINNKNVFFESEARNTLAPIGLLSKKIFDKDKDAVILVFPSDHYIRDEKKFLKIVEDALRAANKGYIVTLGVKPDKPETGYGYIKVRAKIKSSDVYKVERFIEKPDLAKAKKLIRNKRIYWNAGIFIFRADTMLQEIRRFLPLDYKVICAIINQKSLDNLWKKITSISIDYAVMEKTKSLSLIPLDCGWMDLGSWQAVEFFSKKDKSGNIFKGNCIDVGSKNTICWSADRLLATVGLNNVIIVDTKDALLVCAKEKAQEVKKIVQRLKEKKLYKQI